MNVVITCRKDFDAFFREFLAKVDLKPDYQAYFQQSVDRLWLTAREFGLFSSRYQDLLEVGPGFAFLPFLWKASIANRVTIFEGESFELIEFEKVYANYGIESKYGDLFKLFGERDLTRNRLPFGSDRFDGVVCWETMEHFNFNPIPFLQELLRITRKGALVNLTVPNQAKLDMRLRLLFGTSVRTPVDHYFLQMDDRNRMKYGPHWREYTLTEFCDLLQRVGFRILKAKYLNVFMNRESVSPLRAVERRIAALAVKLIPSFSTLCVVQAQKM
jgi:SAM-dependent methyltransferase